MDNEKFLKERNEKLALWGGFRKVVLSGGASLILPNGEIQTNTYSTIHPNYPDFEKIDECIKWLLPKIKELEQFSATILYRGNSINLFWTLELCLCPKEADHVFLTGDTLAEAIEKYVDWVKENEG